MRRILVWTSRRDDPAVKFIESMMAGFALVYAIAFVAFAMYVAVSVLTLPR